MGCAAEGIVCMVVVTIGSGMVMGGVDSGVKDAVRGRFRHFRHRSMKLSMASRIYNCAACCSVLKKLAKLERLCQRSVVNLGLGDAGYIRLEGEHSLQVRGEQMPGPLAEVWNLIIEPCLYTHGILVVDRSGEKGRAADRGPSPSHYFTLARFCRGASAAER